MAGRLTADEAAFLARSGTKSKSTQKSVGRAKTRDRQPRLPVKTMLAVALVSLALCLTAQGVFSAAEPYVKLTGSSDWETLGYASSDLDASDQAYVSSINEVSQVWQYRSTVYVVIIVLAVLVELGLYLQWSMRLSSWEKRREARRKKSKKPVDGGRRSGSGHSDHAGYRAHTEDDGQQDGRGIHAGRHYLDVRPDHAN